MDDPPASSFGELLRRHRLAAGFTQEALAERAGMSAKAVSDLERDPGRFPRLGSVILLADALGMDEAARACLLAAARRRTIDPPSQVVTSPPILAVPRPLNRLVGRANVAAAVAELLRRPDRRLLVLTGSGGVGKTRLAMEVGARLTVAFPDGVLFVDLSTLQDHSLVVGAIAQHLGVDQRDATSLLERLTAALRHRRLLLVLDNFEQVLPAALDVQALLEVCSEVAALVTSRVALPIRGAYNYRVAPLEVAEADEGPEAVASSPAVELFVDRAGAAGGELPGDEGSLTVVAEICRRLDGLPLAIELAAARVNLLPPPALLGRLEQRLPLLVEGPVDLPARQRTMRDTIAWSYELLPPTEQALFRRMSVFAGGCSIEAATAVGGDVAEVSATMVALGTLVQSSLLRAHPPTGTDARMTMLETLREYGLEQLETHGEGEAVRQRHAEYYLALAEHVASDLAGRNSHMVMGRLDSEHDNLRAALGWFHERGDTHGAFLLASRLWRYWHRRGELDEGLHWMRRSLRLAGPERVPGPLRADVLVGAATLAISKASHEEASTYCGEAVQVAADCSDLATLVAALNVRGELASVQDRYGDAVEDHRAALAIAREAGDRSGEAVALLGLARGAMVRGDATGAAGLSEQSVRTAREIGDHQLLVRALHLLCWQSSNTAAYQRAEAVGSEALELVSALGDSGLRAEVLFVLGTVALGTGDYRRAAPLFEEALAIDRARGEELLLARDLAGLGATALNLGDNATARDLVEDSLAAAQRCGDRWSTAMSLIVLGHVEIASGDQGTARDLLGQAALLCASIGNEMYLPWCLEGLAAIAVATGDHAMAANLEGGRDAIVQRTGTSIHPLHRSAHETTIQTAKSALGEERFKATRRAGRAQPAEVIIDAALAATRDADTEHHHQRAPETGKRTKERAT